MCLSAKRNEIKCPNRRKLKTQRVFLVIFSSEAYSDMNRKRLHLLLRSLTHFSHCEEYTVHTRTAPHVIP